MAFVSLNGTLLDAANAHVSLQDRGLRFGDGLFETIAVYGGVPYQFDYHMERLSGGLSELKINFDSSVLKAEAKRVLQANNTAECMLRIQVTRGIGSRGYLPDPFHPQAGPTWFIETMPRPDAPADGISLWLSDYEKTSPRALPTRFKLCQGLNSTLARMQAQEHDCYDALQLSARGHVSETGAANIVWQSGGMLYTPSLDTGALAGSTRAALLRLVPMREAEAGLDTLAAADAVCIVNSALQAVAVAALLPAGHSWQSAALAQRLRSLLHHDIESSREAERHFWLLPTGDLHA